jgi:uncharacterized delta-60 repeat protein
MQKTFSIIVVIFVFHILVFGQSHQQWVATYNGPENLNDGATSVTVDNAGNIISAGYVENIGTGFDCLVIKYNSSGEEQWMKTYNGSANDLDVICAVATDDSGNIYVTGWINQITGLSDIVTIMYDTDGIEKWVNTYNGRSDSYDGGYKIAVDDSGNCYVGGSATNIGTGEDFILLKYNSSGVELWNKTYNGTGNDYDYVIAMTMDDSSNVYITGISVGAGTHDDFTTIKYNSSGEQKWVARYNDPDYNYGETPRSVAVDISGNVYVAGWGTSVGRGDMVTIKYDANGIQQWIDRYHGPSIGAEGAYVVAFDDLGNVYVAGAVDGPYNAQNESDGDYTTIKYSPDGTKRWIATYNGTETKNSWDWILAMKVKPNGEFFVTGMSEGKDVSTIFDIVTIAYDSAGNQQWLERYDGGIGGDDQPSASAMALDLEGNIFVAGFATLDPSLTKDMVTIKYSPEPTSVQTTNSNIPENFLLSQNYPNPFNPNTTIEFAIPQASFVSLKVYNILGQEIKTLLNEYREAGSYTVNFDASNLNSGVYIYKLETGSFSEVKKMTLLK